MKKPGNDLEGFQNLILKDIVMSKHHKGETLVKGHKQCMVCMTLKETDELMVLPKNVPSRMKMIVGWFRCDSCQHNIDEGFVYIIGAVENAGVDVPMKDIKRTGTVAMLTDELFKEVFDRTEVPEDGFMFAGPNVMEQLAIVAKKMGQEDMGEKPLIH